MELFMADRVIGMVLEQTRREKYFVLGVSRHMIARKKFEEYIDAWAIHQDTPLGKMDVESCEE